MKKITWKNAKGGRSFEHLLEGFVDGELAFIVEGRLCVTDLRAMKLSHPTSKYVSPKHYSLNSDGPDVKGEAKGIASDLLNGLNIEKHQANWQRGEDETAQTIKVLKDAQDFLDKLQNRE